MKKMIAFLAVGLLLTAGVASANLIQTPTVVTALGQANWGTTISLPKFDTSLGALDGVSVYFKASGYSEISIDHGTGSGSISWTLGPIVNLSPPGAMDVNDLTKTQIVPWQGAPNSPSNPYIVQTPIFSVEDLIVIPGGSFGSYMGAGDFLASLNVSEFIGAFSASGDFNYATAKNFGGATVYALYDYKPVPEPATMLLLGAGLIGLAGYGRKKLV